MDTPNPKRTSPILVAFAVELWQYRALLWEFTLRNVEVRHRGSRLGFVWSVLNPLLMLGLYVVVFGYINKGRFNPLHPESPIEYALGMLVGLTLFQLFAEVLGTAPVVIVTNPSLVKKVVFPLIVLPASNVGASVFHFLISLGLMLLGVVTVGPGLHWGVLWTPVILLPLLLLLLGMAWFFSALGVFFRDIGQVTGFIITALMFASGVFYSAQTIPPHVWAFLRFNPVLLAIELARNAIMWNQPLNFNHLAYLYASGLICCIAGHVCFSKMKPAFADVL